MSKANLSIVVQDVLKVLIMLGGFLFFSWWFYEAVEGYFNPDPRNLLNINNYIQWIALIALTGLCLFGYQLYKTLKSIKEAYQKRIN